MNKMYPGRVLQLYRLGILAVLVLALSACAVTGSRIQAYDGPQLPDSQVATLQTPATVKVISINGQDTTSYMLEDLALNYGLKPGSNTVIYRYRSIWSRNAAREDGDSAVSVVESDLMETKFTAQPGETYSFAHSEAESVREARQVARDFKARIVNSGGRTIARSEPYKGQPQPAASTEPQVASGGTGGRAQAQAATGAPAVAPNMSTLDALNLLWQRATREEKEAFLRRAFESQ